MREETDLTAQPAAGPTLGRSGTVRGKRIYEAPRLQPLGEIRELTLGGSVSGVESGGFGKSQAEE